MRGFFCSIRERLIHTVLSECERLVELVRRAVFRASVAFQVLILIPRVKSRGDNPTIIRLGFKIRRWLRRSHVACKTFCFYALRTKRMFISDTPYGVSFVREFDGWTAATTTTTTTVDNGNPLIHARRSIWQIFAIRLPKTSIIPSITVCRPAGWRSSDKVRIPRAAWFHVGSSLSPPPPPP